MNVFVITHCVCLCFYYSDSLNIYLSICLSLSLLIYQLLRSYGLFVLVFSYLYKEFSSQRLVGDPNWEPHGSFLESYPLPWRKYSVGA